MPSAAEGDLVIVAVSGTPGTGKTEVAKRLSRSLGWMYVSLNDLAEEEDLYEGYDSKRRCRIVDIDALRREVEILGVSHNNIVIDGHYSHDMPCDIVFVLRTDPKVLRKRLAERKYWKSKLKENMEAELMDVCKVESLEQGKNVYEIDTTHIPPEEAVKRIVNIISDERLVTRDLKIPDHVRPELRKKHGSAMKGGWGEITEKLRKESEGKVLLISVGDHCSYNLIEHGLEPSMIIIDGKEKRKKFGKKIRYEYPATEVKNPAGEMTLEMWKTVEKVMPELELGMKHKIIVEGEEDIAVLPCIMFSPEGTIIVYGLFDRLIKIRVDRKVRKRAEGILREIKEHQ